MSNRVLITGMACATSAGINKSGFIQGLQDRTFALNKDYGKIEDCEIRNVGIISRESHELGRYYVDDESNFITALFSFMIEQVLTDASLPLPFSAEDTLSIIVGSNFGIPLNYWELYKFRQDKTRKIDSPVLDDIFKLRFREDIFARQIQKVLGCGIQKICISMQCASSILSILLAASRIKNTGLSRVIVGGYDFFEPSSYRILKQSGLIDDNIATPFGVNHRGFNFGDGLAFFLLESEEEALKRKAARSYGEIVGGAINCYPSDGAPSIMGITTTIQEALETSNIKSRDIDFISPHGCGIPDLDRAESIAFKRCFGDLINEIPMAVYSPFTGYSFAASGYLDLIAILDSRQNNKILAGSSPEKLDEISDFNFFTDAINATSIKNILKLKLAYSGSVGALIVSPFDI